MKTQAFIVSALEKVFPDERPMEYAGRLTMLRKDQLSFQIAFRMETGLQDMNFREVSVKAESPLEKWLDITAVRCVPCRHISGDVSDGNYLRTTPGMYPDLLEPLDEGKALMEPNCWNAFWVQLRTDAETPAGSHPVTLTLQAGDETLCGVTVMVDIIPAELPPQQLIFTQWFYGDCVADYYGVEVFSERHWELMRAQIEAAAKYGVNMILTPVFTPPLDTAVGKERTTIQLVDVIRQDGVYAFRFDKLRRWVEMCRDCGIRYFEIAHLYTQWGALHCPKIMAEDDGVYRRIFGWEQDATGGEYKAFLRAFLPALTEELERLGLDREHVYFHVSDEPGRDDLAQYNACREQIEPYLRGYRIMDALSEYDFYRDGVCAHPVVATNAVTPFLENHVPDLWVYYCVGQPYQVSNRFIAMPSARNRIIGTQMYKYRIAGFLHWGFNYYNTSLARKHIDPFAVTDAGGTLPAGDPFQVYPGDDGKPWDSIRVRVFYDAVNDMRALSMLEAMTSREYVVELLEGGLREEITFFTYPKESAYLLDLRSRINAEIQARL